MRSLDIATARRVLEKHLGRRFTVRVGLDDPTYERALMGQPPWRIKGSVRLIDLEDKLRVQSDVLLENSDFSVFPGLPPEAESMPAPMKARVLRDRHALRHRVAVIDVGGLIGEPTGIGGAHDFADDGESLVQHIRELKQNFDELCSSPKLVQLLHDISAGNLSSDVLQWVPMLTPPRQNLQ
jgi:hypothetical protein